MVDRASHDLRERAQTRLAGQQELVDGEIGGEEAVLPLPEVVQALLRADRDAAGLQRVLAGLLDRLLLRQVALVLLLLLLLLVGLKMKEGHDGLLIDRAAARAPAGPA